MEIYAIIASLIIALATLITAIIAIVTGTVAAIVAWIGYQQYRLAKDKFKLDLFEKRFAVYKGVQRFLTHIFQDAKLDMNKLYEFRRDTQDCVFLFGYEIPEYLRNIDSKALKMWDKAKEYEDLPRGEERSRLCREETKLLGELTDELPNLKDVFAPYLKFDRWK